MKNSKRIKNRRKLKRALKELQKNISLGKSLHSNLLQGKCNKNHIGIENDHKNGHTLNETMCKALCTELH